MGIGNASSCGRVEFRERDTVCHYLWTMVYVAGNYIDNTGRNNVIARVSKDAVYEYNIFFFKGRGKWGKNADGINTSFHNNLYFNIPPHKSDTSPIAANPMLIQPGIAGTDIDLKTMAALRGYRLRPGSPCIDTGVTINNHGGKDLLRTKVMIGKTDVGAFERD